jgi:hypothetical protein
MILQLVEIDHFSNWADVHAMPDAKALTVAQHIIITILKFGIPDQILTDQGKNYQAEMLQHMYDLLDIYKTKTVAYNPQCDGGSEVFKQMIYTSTRKPKRLGSKDSISHIRIQHSYSFLNRFQSI